MKLNTFKTDTKKEEEGTWINVGQGFRILVRHIGNKAYKKFLRKIARTAGPGFRKQSAEVREQMGEDALKEGLSRYILVGWEGLEDEDGTQIEHSPEKALEILKDPQYREFYEFVVEQANNSENFKSEFTEESEGN